MSIFDENLPKDWIFSPGITTSDPGIESGRKSWDLACPCIQLMFKLYFILSLKLVEPAQAPSLEKYYAKLNSSFVKKSPKNKTTISLH
jgi:hypothetical protein